MEESCWNEEGLKPGGRWNNGRRYQRENMHTSRSAAYDYVEKEKAVAKALEDLKANFYCELCNKQYQKHQEFDNHINSYDHAHKQRLKELKQREFARNVSSKSWKDEKKQEKALKRLYQLAELKRQSACIPRRGPLFSPTKLPVESYKEDDKALENTESNWHANNSNTFNAEEKLQAKHEEANVPFSQNEGQTTCDNCITARIPLSHASSNISSNRRRVGVSFCISKKAQVKLESSASVFSDNNEETTENQKSYGHKGKIVAENLRAFTSSSEYSTVHVMESQRSLSGQTENIPPCAKIKQLNRTKDVCETEKGMSDIPQCFSCKDTSDFPVTVLNDINDPAVKRIKLNNSNTLSEISSNPFQSAASTTEDNVDKTKVTQSAVELFPSHEVEKYEQTQDEDCLSFTTAENSSDSPVTVSSYSDDMRAEAPDVNPLPKPGPFLHVRSKDNTNTLQWPSELLLFTKTKPHLSYSCNPLYFDFKLSKNKARQVTVHQECDDIQKNNDSSKKKECSSPTSDGSLSNKSESPLSKPKMKKDQTDSDPEQQESDNTNDAGSSEKLPKDNNLKQKENMDREHQNHGISPSSKIHQKSILLQKRKRSLHEPNSKGIENVSLNSQHSANHSQSKDLDNSISTYHCIKKWNEKQDSLNIKSGNKNNLPNFSHNSFDETDCCTDITCRTKVNGSDSENELESEAESSSSLRCCSESSFHASSFKAYTACCNRSNHSNESMYCKSFVDKSHDYTSVGDIYYSCKSQGPPFNELRDQQKHKRYVAISSSDETDCTPQLINQSKCKCIKKNTSSASMQCKTIKCCSRYSMHKCKKLRNRIKHKHSRKVPHSCSRYILGKSLSNHTSSSINNECESICKKTDYCVESDKDSNYVDLQSDSEKGCGNKHQGSPYVIPYFSSYNKASQGREITNLAHDKKNKLTAKHLLEKIQSKKSLELPIISTFMESDSLKLDVKELSSKCCDTRHFTSTGNIVAFPLTGNLPSAQKGNKKPEDAITMERADNSIKSEEHKMNDFSLNDIKHDSVINVGEINKGRECSLPWTDLQTLVGGQPYPLDNEMQTPIEKHSSDSADFSGDLLPDKCDITLNSQNSKEQQIEHEDYNTGKKHHLIDSTLDPYTGYTMQTDGGKEEEKKKQRTKSISPTLAEQPLTFTPDEIDKYQWLQFQAQQHVQQQLLAKNIKVFPSAGAANLSPPLAAQPFAFQQHASVTAFQHALLQHYAISAALHHNANQNHMAHIHPIPQSPLTSVTFSPVPHAIFPAHAASLLMGQPLHFISATAMHPAHLAFHSIPSAALFHALFMTHPNASPTLHLHPLLHPLFTAQGMRHPSGPST
ncbi:zinc finger protein 804B [Protopterus annectens]|uniref:zinc finger protein 804B n=1 Tax=Protopterus annectens TaxID=7888 RepID=UPI001CFA9453|nr:zinc finger protein 804B [Protopterus annectens]